MLSSLHWHQLLSFTLHHYCFIHQLVGLIEWSNHIDAAPVQGCNLTLVSVIMLMKAFVDTASFITLT